MDKAENDFAMSEWQPIETAPKDGTWIIGFSSALNQPSVMKWSPFIMASYEAVDGGLYRKVERDCSSWHTSWAASYGAGGGSFFEPTFWMPFPDPPVATA